MSFEKLLQDLEILAKAQAAPGEGQEDDEAIQAAAAEGGDPGNDGDSGAYDGDGDGDGDEDELLGKSFAVVLENGEEAEAFDASALVKAMTAQVRGVRDALDSEHEQLSKALTTMVEVMDEQGKLIKSLQEQVAALASSGSGRRSQIAADPSMVKSQGGAEPLAGLEPPQILAKCEDAFKAGKITGLELSTAEAALNRRMPLPNHISVKLQ